MQGRGAHRKLAAWVLAPAALTNRFWVVPQRRFAPLWHHPKAARARQCEHATGPRDGNGNQTLSQEAANCAQISYSAYVI